MDKLNREMSSKRSMRQDATIKRFVGSLKCSYCHSHGDIKSYKNGNNLFGEIFVQLK